MLFLTRIIYRILHYGGWFLVAYRRMCFTYSWQFLHIDKLFFILLNQNIMSISLLEPQVKFNCFKFVSSSICTGKKREEKSETISLDILLMNYCTQNALIIYIFISFLLLFFPGLLLPNTSQKFMFTNTGVIIYSTKTSS